MTDRGAVGLTPRPPSRDDESYLDFVEGLRLALFTKGFGTLAQEIDATLDARGVPADATTPDLDGLRAAVDPLPLSKAWRRMMRTSQEMMWRRTQSAFAPTYADWAAKLEAAEKKGPGRLLVDPAFITPERYRREIHLMPGGYTDDPMGGLVFHYGTKVFYLGGNDSDEIQTEIANLSVAPEDGAVARVVNFGCTIGQVTLPLKRRFPDADVWGLDVGLPMLRYAHARAVEQDVDVTFQQALVQDTGFDDASVDMIVSYILFHEVPIDDIPLVLKEAARILRPGGTFSIFEFPTAAKGMSPAHRWMVQYDSADNCEPYSVDFVWSDFEGMLKDAGFETRPGPATSPMFPEATVAIKR